MNVERAGRRGRGGVGVALVAWLVVLGGTIALGVAGRGDETVPAAEVPAAVVPLPAAPSVPVPAAAAPSRAARTPLPTQPPIGEDGIMGGLPFGTAWHWLQPD